MARKKRVDEYNVKTLALWVRYGWPIAFGLFGIVLTVACLILMIKR